MSGEPVVLLVEDDPLFREAVCDHFAAAGLRVDGVGTLAEARELMAEMSYAALLLDDQLPDGKGTSLLDATGLSAATPALVVTAHPALDSAVAGLRHGIEDYLEKPVDLDALRSRVIALIPDEAHREEHEPPSSAGRVVREAVRRASGSRSPVLLTGETGTGKTFLARTIHEGAHVDRPFVHVNCAALPETLIEAELFGTEAGAFTGAKAKAGLLEAAGRGTIFLDEIGEMPVTLQAKLLQCLESAEIRRVGGLEPRPLRARVIAATNVDLDEAVDGGRFRADLRYRLEVLRIRVPPLRERRDDIPRLARVLLEGLANRAGVRVPDAELECLRDHDWPGNIRELRNVLERSLLYAEDGVARPSRMIVPGTDESTVAQRATAEPSTKPTIPPMPLDALEREQILRTLERLGGHRKRTAKALGIGVATLRRKLHGYRDEGFAERIARIDRSERSGARSERSM